MGLYNKIKRLLNIDTEINIVQRQIEIMNQNSDDIKLLLSKQLIHLNKSLSVKDNIQKAEFKTFSQWGDDGIIQHLISNLDIENKTFIEFGVENYTESNTRFLLIHNNWSGLVIDGSEENIFYIRNEPISWKYQLKAVSAFITKDNINEIILSAEFNQEVGLLSIDIDGNDYWIWESINVINPVIVIVEYNSLFGSKRTITVPYKSDFKRNEEHFSNLFFGASLPALCYLAEKKNYYFIGTNSSGVNAYFLRKDKVKNFKSLTVDEGYTLSKFSESRNEHGNLSHLSHQEAIKLIQGLWVFNVYNNELEPL